MSFAPFNLHPDILKAVNEQGYDAPTPIQLQAIPPILKGHDVLGLAQTGTGKTAAFVLPLLQQLMEGPRRRLRALILAPTRELAAQTNDCIRALGRHSRLRSTVIFGGVNMNPQIEALKHGVEIIVACPGRLLDHLSHKTIDCSTLETLVIDEADRMFDMGFIADIRRVVRHIPQQRQTLLFSATMPPDIRHLAAEMLTKPVTVQINHTKPVSTIAHALYPVEQHLKTALLKEVLKRTETASVIVFTRTKHRAKRLAEQLTKTGFKTTSLQGNLSQNRREEAIAGFRSGAYQILVATDIAARGIDISAVSHVINYDMPDTVDAYTHRIGRTGRISRSGEAFTFVTHEDRAMVVSIEHILGESMQRVKLPDFDYNRSKEKEEPLERPLPSGMLHKRHATPGRAQHGHAAAHAKPRSAASPAASGQRRPAPR